MDDETRGPRWPWAVPAAGVVEWAGHAPGYPGLALFAARGPLIIRPTGGRCCQVARDASARRTVMGDATANTDTPAPAPGPGAPPDLAALTGEPRLPPTGLADQLILRLADTLQALAAARRTEQRLRRELREQREMNARLKDQAEDRLEQIGGLRVRLGELEDEVRAAAVGADYRPVGKPAAEVGNSNTGGAYSGGPVSCEGV